MDEWLTYVNHKRISVSSVAETHTLSVCVADTLSVCVCGNCSCAPNGHLVFNVAATA